MRWLGVNLTFNRSCFISFSLIKLQNSSHSITSHLQLPSRLTNSLRPTNHASLLSRCFKSNLFSISLLHTNGFGIFGLFSKHFHVSIKYMGVWGEGGRLKHRSINFLSFLVLVAVLRSRFFPTEV